MASVASQLRQKSWRRDYFLISTDPSKVPISEVIKVFESDEMHWTKPLPEDAMREMVDSCLFFAVYDTEQAQNTPDDLGESRTFDPKFIGMARCITDFTTVMYITDVWIHPAYREEGLGTWLMQCVQEFNNPPKLTMHFPKLPPSAAYIRLSNPARRNALSLSVLQDLKKQLIDAHTSPVSRQIRLLPSLKPFVLEYLEEAAKGKQTGSDKWERYGWLVSASEWKKERAGLPDVLVLRSEGPVFSSGHDLKELSQLSHGHVKELFRVCADVMGLIRRSPALVVCPIQGLATAAGFQLAMTTDFPIALPDTQFSLPGAKIGLPCTSPSTAISRRFPPAATYRMLATAEPITASEYPGAVDVVKVSPGENPEEAFEKRVASVIEQLTEKSAQQQAIGKWAFGTQLGIGLSNDERGLDPYKIAAKWAGRVMALHAKSEDAKEGMSAFLEKRKPVWTSKAELQPDEILDQVLKDE
ncbi:Enoyl-CoA hydratase domain-containing protein 3, mitochondrial [Fusarium austroafricanum]|uniref:Enoyl-CoA hydratase domain-containing protein 3, mitochondrial n=1 Tax=Fusarium austroafricanum TaxID=2364996 RepID=A0A8H4JT58_9HYPO|nr:Enoyl-CoA hydratase domain-containing protein 3, mitochondrial [Fusarium austroafricanum]